ncbi:unnamed protein product, partial [Mesorhabditis belari]|uniref:7TM GPCR serpentine receptor class x (Srx) domain-containing protein n=1 Tax=Mesorhabditis belari TaxID=2138241 RepID=A0AAF3EHL0_9BILA
MGVLGFIGSITGFLGILAVKRTSFADLVKHYMLFDLSNYTLVNLCHLFWAVPCATFTLTTSVPFLDHIFANLANAASSQKLTPKVFLGINRLFAISFNGLYYQSFERTKNFQYLVLFLQPFGTFLALFLPSCNCIYVPFGVNSFMFAGECGYTILYWSMILPGTISLPLTALLDGTFFVLLWRTMRDFRRDNTSQQKAEATRKEVKLALQMLTSFIINFLNFMGLYCVTGLLPPNSVPLVVTSTFSWQLSAILFSLSYVLILWDPQRVSTKQKITVISSMA